MDGDEITVIFDEEEQKKSRLTLEGERVHFYEVGTSLKSMNKGRMKC
jgi:hypothetical protein